MDVADLINFNESTAGESTRNIINIERESIPYIKRSGNVDCSNRESLGVLRLDTSDIPSISFQLLNDSVFNGINDPLSFSAHFDESDYGRQSLGLLHPDFFKLSMKDADLLTLPNSNEDVSCQLNTAFLLPYSYRNNRTSIISSTSSLNSANNGLSFNSKSLGSNTPSPIYSISTANNSERNSILNDAILNSIEFRRKLNSSNNSITSAATNEVHLDLEKGFRQKIQSMPVILEQRHDESIGFCNKDELNKIASWSDTDIQKRLITSTATSDEHTEEDDFNDSVFAIEAQHIASKIADGSILETSIGEVNILDSTSEPQWEELLEEDHQDSIKNKTETIFKAVDRMIPASKEQEICNSDCIGDSQQNINRLGGTEQSNTGDYVSDGGQLKTCCCSVIDSNKKTNTSSNNVSHSSSSLSRNDLIQNLSEIFSVDAQKLSTSQISQHSNKSKSRDTKEILQNLSDILKTENRSAEQKFHGQNLLISLADILCKSGNARGDGSSEDSGHSSIDTDRDENEVLSREQSNNAQIDTEQNTKVPAANLVTQRRKSGSFSCPRAKTSPKLNAEQSSSTKSVGVNEVRRCRSMSVSSIDKESKKNEPGVVNNKRQNRNSLTSNLSKLPSLGKFKPKKTDDRTIGKKGPMKAVLPVCSMSRQKGHDKTSKVNTTSKTLSSYMNKHTSTPIAGLKMKPVAQSTPDGTNTSSEQLKQSPQVCKRKFDYPVSPLARPNSISDISNNSSANKTNQSDTNLSHDAKTSGVKCSNPTMNRRRSASDLKAIEKPRQLKRSYSIGKESTSLTSIAKAKENALRVKNVQLVSDGVRDESASKIAIYKNRSSLTGRSLSKSVSNIKPFNLMAKLKCSAEKENAGH